MKKVTRVPRPPWHKPGATAHLLQILSPRDEECSWQLCTPGRQRGGRDGPGTPAAQGHQAGATKLEAGTPSRALGEPPGPAKPESRLSASGALSFHFSPSTYPRLLLPPRTLLPKQPEPDTLRQRGQSRCRTSGSFLLTGPTAVPAVSRTHSKPSQDAWPEPRSAAASPACPPHSPRAPRRYSALCLPPTAPARFHLRRARWEPGASSRREGLWEAAEAGPGRS